MFGSKTKVYFDGETVHIVDPSREHLPLIRKANRNFREPYSLVPENIIPVLHRMKRTYTGLRQDALVDMEPNELWAALDYACSGEVDSGSKTSASVIDVCLELDRREYASCMLCGHECRANRYQRPGLCGLTHKAYVASVFTHISEEQAISPSGTLKLFGCALNCNGCQSHELIHKKESYMAEHGVLLDRDIWGRCAEFKDAATITLVGGNPTENLLPILIALAALPSWLERKPIVWNDHGYTTKRAYDLLRCFVDVYVTDFKGTTPCLEQYAHIPHYWETATAGMDEMVTHPAGIIVRHLLVPGHFECCTVPVLEWLARYKERVWMSLIEYLPDSRALKDPALNRSTSTEELAAAHELMQKLGLRDVEANPEAFWNEQP